MNAAYARAIAGAALACCALAPVARADGKPIAARVGVDERIGVSAPLDAVLFDQSGHRRSLREFLAPDTPLLISLAYYHCPGLCDVSLRELASRMRQLGWTLGADYRALTISIDPHDTQLTAAAKRASVLRFLQQPLDAAWDFTTASEPTLERLTQTLGYRYDYDPGTRQYAHPAVSVVLTPAGTVARYLYGPTIEVRTLELALREARAGRGSPTAWIDRTLLACFRYDAATHRYEWLITSIVRGGAALFAVLLAIAIAIFVRRGRLRRAEA